MRRDEELHETVDPRRVWQLLSAWLNPDEGVVERATIYTFHSVVADCWRRGRLLIAGDAAHQTPPFLGQGLCTGIRDTANLYWKLALLCGDRVADSDAQRLLNSYESERASHTREYIAAAVRLGALINTSDPAAALRTASFAADGTPRITSIAPRLGPGLGSVGKVGCLFSQPRLADGRLMDEVYAHRFIVVVDAALVAAMPVPTGMAIVTTATSPDAAAHLAQLGVRAAVLRPDRYTLGTADTSEELTSLLGGVWLNPNIATEIAHT